MVGKQDALDLIRSHLDSVRVAMAVGQTMTAARSLPGIEQALDMASGHLEAARALLAGVFNNTSNTSGEEPAF